MVFASIFGTLANLVLITEAAKITRDTIKSTADQAKKPKSVNGFGITNQNSFIVKPININVQGILKDFKIRKGLI